MKKLKFIKGWNEFKNYSYKEVVKINIISSIIYFIILKISIISSLLILNDSRRDKYNLTLFSLAILLSGLIVVLYTTLMPLFININSKFFKNMESFIGVIICCLITTIYIGILFDNISLASNYILLCYGGIMISLGGKYTSIKLNITKNK